MEFIPLWEIDNHEEGIKEGIKKGIKKGIAEGKKETAQRMLNDDFPIENIAKYTGLSENEIKALMH
jgi:predicted transposase/invertase (TIGR01784 family)